MVLNRFEENIDIIHLNTEAPPKETLSFDAEREIDQQVWDKLNSLLEKWKSESPDVFVQFGLPMAAHMRLLFPDRPVRLNVSAVDQQQWSRVDLPMEVILKPEVRHKDAPRLEIAYEGWADKLHQYANTDDWDNFLSVALRMRLVKPEARDNIGKPSWERMKKFMQGPDLFKSMALAKLLYPLRFKDLDIKPEYWRQWRQLITLPSKLDQLQPTEIMEQLWAATALRVLAAKTAVITENGIEYSVDYKSITLPKEESEQLPLTRNF
jgi:hypothetical protein